MIQSVTFHGFKAFNDLRVEGLRRINVLVGESGSGKTAFLEGLFLVAGASAELYFRTRRWRGYPENMEITRNTELQDAIGRELFHSPEDQSATLRFSDSESGPRLLKIFRRTGAQESLLSDGGSADAVTRPIMFQWRVGGRTFDSSVQVTKDGVKVKANGRVYRGIMLTPNSMGHRDNVQRFSALSRRSAHLPLVEAIQSVYPDISDLSLEMSLGQVMLYATVEGFPEKLPLPAISGGLNKYISIALAIIDQPGGVVLVDEIENGFYYKSMRPLLKSLYDLADSFNVQLFATCHSYEFLEAMADVMKDHSDDFALLRVSRTGPESSVRMVSGMPAVQVVKNDFEIR